MPQVRPILKQADRFLKFLIVLGTIVYLAEISTRSSSVVPRQYVFLWAEGLIALIFTIEYAFVTALAIFAGVLGVFGASFYKVMEEELDPDIDPIAEFQKESERQLHAFHFRLGL
jgi:hypothetical protein